MKEIEKFYEVLLSFPKADLDFAAVCRAAMLDEAQMDAILKDEFGFGGEEVIKSFKFDLPLGFL